jgi:septal ring-binding cell division protein DamX
MRFVSDGGSVRVENTHKNGRLVMKSVSHLVIAVLTVVLFQRPAVAKDQSRLLLASKSAALLAFNSQPIVVRKKVYPQETAENTGRVPVVVRKKVPPPPATPEEESTTQPPQPNANETGDDQSRPESTIGEELSPKVGSEPTSAQTVSASDVSIAETQREGQASGLSRTPPAETVASPSQTAPQTGETAAGASETSPPELFSSHPYSLMLSSCRLKENARNVVADYRNKGLSPFIVKVELGKGQVWWRTMAGSYQTREEAAKAKEKYGLADAVIKKTPYTNLVGTFPSEQNARDEVRRLEKLGYSPYPVNEEKSLRLLVGAFETREGAAKQQAELESQGISSQIIER